MTVTESGILTIARFQKVIMRLFFENKIKMYYLFKEGSMRDILSGTKPQNSFLKKMGSNRSKTLQLNDIRYKMQLKFK